MNMSDLASMAGHQRRRRFSDGGDSAECVGVIDGGSLPGEGDLHLWATTSAWISRQRAEHAIIAADRHRVGWHRNGNVWLTGKPVVGKRCQTTPGSWGNRKARSTFEVAASGGEFLRSVWRL
jgi:hypothetical protein